MPNLKQTPFDFFKCLSNFSPKSSLHSFPSQTESQELSLSLTLSAQTFRAGHHHHHHFLRQQRCLSLSLSLKILCLEILNGVRSQHQHAVSPLLVQLFIGIKGYHPWLANAAFGPNCGPSHVLHAIIHTPQKKLSFF